MKFVFCIVALLIQPVFSYIVYRKQDKKQAALQMPMLYMSGAYLVIQAFVFFKYCIKFPEAVQWFSFLIQGAILVAFLLIECTLLLSNRYITMVDKKEQDSISDFSHIFQELEVKKVTIKDVEKVDILNKVYDTMSYADKVSSKNIEPENKMILQLIHKLSNDSEVSQFKEQCTQILDLLETRKIKNIKERG